MKNVNNVKFLGDVINKNGDNHDLIEDRVTRGKSCMISSFSLCNEVSLGCYFIPTLMLLYTNVFLATVLYNSQAWSRITKSDMCKLEVVQLKYLKRMLQTPSSTPNVCVFLDTGQLPIKGEIDKQRLIFLHHILTCENDNPVKIMYTEQRDLPYEHNWANEVVSLVHEYNITETEEEIKEFSKGEWRRIVREKVTNTTLECLKREAANHSKSKMLTYSKFCTQTYLVRLPPYQARIIFKARSRSINCKSNRRSTFKDDLCRLCSMATEDQSHIVNCHVVVDDERVVDINRVFDIKCDSEQELNELEVITTRLETFENKLQRLRSHKKLE